MGAIDLFFGQSTTDRSEMCFRCRPVSSRLRAAARDPQAGLNGGAAARPGLCPASVIGGSCFSARGEGRQSLAYRSKW
jgi:hypothetical protein